MKIAVAQMVSGLDIQANKTLVEQFIAEAAASQAETIFFPENVLIMGDQSRLGAYIQKQDLIETWLKPLCKKHHIGVHMGSLPFTHRLDGHPVDNGRLRATQLWLDHEGQALARYDKIHLFDAQVQDAQGAYRESDIFEPGDQPQVCDYKGFCWGLSICYDLRFGQLYEYLRSHGAEIFLVPAAFTAITGEHHWLPLLKARAIEYQCYVIAANQGGQHCDKRSTFGHSVVIDPWGRVLALQDYGPGLIYADLSKKVLDAVRSAMPVRDHRVTFPVSKN